MTTSKYQTLNGFILAPFHSKESLDRNMKYDTMYRKFSSEHKISIYAMCQVEESYYIHIKVPSESQKSGNYMYDVVVRFFTDKNEVIAQTHLKNYYVQFYSNSPSFIYQYAYLYKKEGYLIDTLYDKLDKAYIDKPPEKANSNMNLSYDKTIYIACRFLSEMKFRYLDKRGAINSKKKDKNKFFREISDFQSAKFDQELMNEERKLTRNLKTKKEKSSHRSSNDQSKKTATNSTSNSGIKSITIIPKKGGKAKVVKKTAIKSTRKR